MPIKLNIQPSSAKVGGSTTPVAPLTSSAGPAQAGASSSGAMAGLPKAPSSPPNLIEKKTAPPRNTSQFSGLPPPTTMTSTPSKFHHPKPLLNTSTAQQPFDEDDEFPAPPYSPITPPLATTPPPHIPESNNTRLTSTPNMSPPKTVTHIPPPVIPPNYASMAGRAPLTHKTHADVVPSAPPPPLEPIDFETNTDVIAIQSAMMLLMRQKKQAEADIKQLQDAKKAAMLRPEEFYMDLVGGGITQGTVKAQNSEDDDDDMEDDEGDDEMKTEGDSAIATNGHKPSAMGAEALKKKRKRKKNKGKGKATASTSNKNSSNSNSSSAANAAPPWANLPKQQDIYRMPPINWGQYAVEGEALDKVHNKQLTHPAFGSAAVIGADGSYEFTGATNLADGKKVDGISAPFDPLRDTVEEKKPPKGAPAPRRGV